MLEISAEAKLAVIRDWHWHDTINPNTCLDAECFLCGILCCPDGDIMRFHPNGCPSCAGRVNAGSIN